MDCGRIAGLDRATAGAYSTDVGSDTNLCEKSRNWLEDRYSMARWRSCASAKKGTWQSVWKPALGATLDTRLVNLIVS
jgi:hypothetical protein